MISDVFFPRVNGVSTSIETLRKELHKLDIETVLVAPDYTGSKKTYLEKDTGITRVPSRKVPFDPEDRLMSTRGVCQALENFGKSQFDLVHIHTPFVAHYSGVKWARQSGLPTVETYHTFFEEYLYHYIPLLPKSWSKFLARRLTVSQCKKVSSLIVPSSPMLKTIRDYGVSCPAETIPTGIEAPNLIGNNSGIFRRRFGISQQQPVVVHVGRLAFEKNIFFLIDMLQRLVEDIPNVIMVIAGEGPATKALKSRVECLGLTQNVLFVGYLSRNDDLWDCFRAGDAFVFASRTETQGLVLLEAMALGVPVVSTAVMGTRDVLQDGLGCLVADEDVADFSSKVTQVLTDRILRARLGEQGKRYARRWSASEMSARVADYYDDILSSTDGFDEEQELSVFPTAEAVTRK